ncbi:MAG: hypothetical protein FJ317_09120 [SAR202 cluster bacterium]|nr:hypothetical protein [SAR202 cluster bacterium]
MDTERNGPAMLELADYPFRVRAELAAACKPGDVVTLRLHGVDLWRRVGNFTYVANPTTHAPGQPRPSTGSSGS